MYLQVIDQAGNKTDYESTFVPRIGELILLTYKNGNDAMRQHYFRVRDVVYRFDNKPDNQAAILLGEEETSPKFWPS